MRSGVVLTCGLLLLGGCAHSNGLQSAGHAPRDLQDSTTKRDSSTPIQLVAYPDNRKPPVGLGHGNPWQSNNDNSIQQANQSVEFESSDSQRQPLAIQNSNSQIHRVNKLKMGFSLPPESADMAHHGTNGNSFGTAPRGYTQPNVQTLDYHEPPPQIRQRAEFGPVAQSAPAETGVIIPSDWNPDAMDAPRGWSQEASRPEIDETGPSVNHSIMTHRGHSQPILQTQYADVAPMAPNQEILLRPGQSLPGFMNPQQRIPPTAEPRRIAPKSVRVPTSPSASLPTRQSPMEALKFLTSTTEREVAALSPGQTAAELQYYIERHVYLRLLYLMAGQTEWALRPIPNIPASDQEFWTQVLWGVHSYFDMHQIPNPADRAAQTISQFNTAILRLKERAPLELKNVVFSHKIDGFGEYETYPKDEFAPGQRVLVYAEIGNFHSELTADGIYRTQLKSTLEFYSVDGSQEPIDSKVYPVTEDFCRNHRRDYFHSYVADIPPRCGKGRHVLKLIIEDELSGKTAEYPIEFGVR